jgi:hypothetical protein
MNGKRPPAPQQPNLGNPTPAPPEGKPLAPGNGERDARHRGDQDANAEQAATRRDRPAPPAPVPPRRG